MTAQSVRQSELFAGESWLAIYQAFTKVNFNAYDFDTIRTALVNYVRINYPEDFNDWINSSEFIAVLDLVAYLGQSLAYRMDLNSRENFIDSAERRESLLRLAQFLSYKPRRNLPGRGLLRIESVSTNDDLIDASGQNLNGLTVFWNDPNNPDWFDQFVLILNNAFLQSNQFGQPLKSVPFEGTTQQVYQINSTPSGFGTQTFSALVDGLDLSFDVVNTTLTDDGVVTEVEPSPTTPISLLYRSDGNGFASPNTGFFFYFKQGSLGYTDFRLDFAIENRVLDINTSNINELDVWVQSIDEGGIPTAFWTKVPAVSGSNVIFNSINKNIRNVFEVIPRENDQISIRFADNRFGNAPTGLIRVLYRVSENASYTINTQDIQGITLTYGYLNSRGQSKGLTVQLGLTANVSNSALSESLEEIRRNAPRIFYTQNRMVNGEDYNVFPLTNTSALKIKSINRIYSGQSRYLDINDPTGRYQATNVFADDGILFTNSDIGYTEVPIDVSLTSDEIIAGFIQPSLQNQELLHFIIEKLKNNVSFPVGVAPNNPSAAQYNPWPAFPVLRWKASTNANFSSTGYFYIDTSPLGDNSNPLDPNTPSLVGAVPPQSPQDVIGPGAYVKFDNNQWVVLQSVTDNGNGNFDNGQGKITLAESVPSGTKVIQVIPAFRPILNASEQQEIKNLLDGGPQQFALYWNWFTQSWETYTFVNESASFDPNTFKLLTLNSETNIQLNRQTGWVLLMSLSADGVRLYTIQTRGTQYVFESEREARFWFANTLKSINLETGDVNVDQIRVFAVNPPAATLTPIPSPFDSWDRTRFTGSPMPNGDIDLSILNNFVYRDGYIEPRRIQVTFADSDRDGYVDNPDAFDQIIGSSNRTFWEKYIDQYGYRYYRPALNIRLRSDPSNLEPPTLPPILQGEVVFLSSTQKFYRAIVNDPSVISELEEITESDQFIVKNGRAKLNFLWKHFASTDQRIDPAITNVIDIFVLDRSYDTALRQWVTTNGNLNSIPRPPSSFDLSVSFAALDDVKMISDQLIYHPVKYKLLYGTRAPEELRAKFLVVKIPTSRLSDGEIKSGIIQAINEFFQTQNWDFGQTVYFSELAAYIHLKLATSVASIALVPLNQEGRFGNLYQIKLEPDEMPISVAGVNDIEIVKSLTETNLRAVQ